MRDCGYARIPLKHGFRNRFYGAGKLRGTRVSFLIDTGSADVLVDVREAGKFKSLGKSEVTRWMAHSRVTNTVETVLLDRMELSGTVISNQPAMVRDLHKGREIKTGSMIPVSSQTETEDVILGMSFLEPTHAVLDCVTPALYLRGEQPTKELVTNMQTSFEMGGFVRADMLKTATGPLVLMAEVNGQNALFIVDTGAQFTLCDEDELAQFGLTDREKLGRTSDLVEKHEDLRHTTFKSLKLGKVELKDLPVGVSRRMPYIEELSRRSKLAGKPPVLGLLGPEVLCRSGALIDCSTGTTYLQAAAAK